MSNFEYSKERARLLLSKRVNSALNGLTDAEKLDAPNPYPNDFTDDQWNNAKKSCAWLVQHHH